MIAAIAGIAIISGSTMALADNGPLKISDAWIPVVEKSGSDVPLLMTIQNDTSSADALTRVRCEVANFSEKHTVDRGEGAPAMRAIRSIPIPAGSTLMLKPDGYHVMLLQTRQLPVGERFTCSISFQHSGTIETEVQVRKTP
jgi:copper(I)-binding protein